MAHAFDNRTVIPGKQQTFYSLVSPSARPDTTNVLWETSSHSPQISASPQASPRPNHPPPSYEESVFNKALANRHNSQSSLHSPSLRYFSHSPNPGVSPYISYSSPCTPNGNSVHHQRPPPPPPPSSTRPDEYHSFISPRRSSDTKPPPPARIPKIPPTDEDHALAQFSPNGMKTSTTYLNTTQIHISQVSRESPAPPPPPPPPPRYPLRPPAVPPRASSISTTNDTLMSPQVTSQSIYRSPVICSTAKRNDLIDYLALERRLNSLSIENDQCHKCAEGFQSSDDICEIHGHLYHHFCAVCVLCGRSVKDKHFFVKDQLYCEEDFLYTGYHQTLERCVACQHLITDTLLQALGQSYHLKCFKCSKCFKSLDDVPFITDKEKNLFCLHDYHMTYAPRCDKCFNPICPEENSNETVRIISMGKTFHVQCYQCQDCSIQLSDEPSRRCYPLGETLLCQGCCRRRLVSVHQQLQ